MYDNKRDAFVGTTWEPFPCIRFPSSRFREVISCKTNRSLCACTTRKYNQKSEATNVFNIFTVPGQIRFLFYVLLSRCWQLKQLICRSAIRYLAVTTNSVKNDGEEIKIGTVAVSKYHYGPSERLQIEKHIVIRPLLTCTRVRHINGSRNESQVQP